MIGFDSPEEKQRFDEAMTAFRQWFKEVAEAMRQVGQTIVEIITEAFAPILRRVTALYRAMLQLHLIPRQYRDTMMRRKIRRYYAFVQLRT